MLSISENPTAFLLYLAPPLLATLISAGISQYVWRKRSITASKTFAILTLLVAEWCLGYFFELAWPNVAGKLLWAKIQYVGIVYAPVAWLVFSLKFNRREKGPSTLGIIGLALVPTAILAFAITNENHLLIWSAHSLDTSGLIPTLNVDYGPAFWLHTLYAYSLMLAGVLIFARRLRTTNSSYRTQIFALLIAAAAPWLGNVFYVTKWYTPIPNLDLTPFGFIIACTALLWGFIRHRFLNILPVAREKLISKMNEGVLVLDLQNQIIDVNPAAIEILEKPAQELIGQPVPAAFNIRAAIAQSNPNVTHTRTEFFWKAGPPPAYYELILSPLHNKTEELTGRLAILRDISQQKRTEQALRAYNNRLHILREIDHAILTARTLKEVALAAITQLKHNVVCQRISVIKLDKRIKQATILATVPDDSTYFSSGQVFPYNADEISESNLSGVQDLTLKVFDPQHETHPAGKTIPPFNAPLLAQGHLIGILSIETQNTKTLPKENATIIREVAAQLSIAMQNAHLHDEMQRRIVQLQTAAEVARDAASAQNGAELLTRTANLVKERFGFYYAGIYLVDESRAYAVLQSATNSAGQILLASKHKVKIGEDGIVGDAALTGKPCLAIGVEKDTDRLHNSLLPETRSAVALPLKVGDKILGALSVQSMHPAAFDEHDVSVLQTMADQLAIALEHIRLLSEAQHRADELVIALEKQAELDKLKDEFIQNVSHELRTPLSIIRGYAELLDSGELGELNPVIKDPIATISRRSLMLSDMVDDLIAILTVQEEALYQEKFNLGNLAQAMADDFEVAAEKAGLMFKVQTASGLPKMSGEIDKMRRVVDNLVSNAIKFTPEGGKIKVSVSQADEHLLLEVSDTGIGIAADKIGRVFERFYQIDGSATRRYGGTGLGLALVKEIVDAHGGDISIESVVGRGSNFRVKLPITAA